MDDLRLALRAFRWRRGGSLVVLLAGALTVAAAALGPLFASAAAESVLQDRLTQAGAHERLVIGDEDPDRHAAPPVVKGIRADTRQPASAGPASSVPP